MPVLPGLTDSKKDLDALASAARDAGAQWFAANVLFLMPSSREQFFPFLDAKFPRLSRQYREWYGHAGYAPESYRREIKQRIVDLRKKYGLKPVPPLSAGSVSRNSPQLSLFKGQ
jgi:DNA repair photolyase